MKSLMLRHFAIAFLILPGLALPQGVMKIQKERAKALDAAAMTPFFTKKGAESVKRVMSGADVRKADEKVLDPLESKPGIAVPAGHKTADPAALQPQAPAQPAAAPPQPVFEWHLIGISYGKKQGMALFQSGGRTMSVRDGATLDAETKIVSINKRRVILIFQGKRLELTPW